MTRIPNRIDGQWRAAQTDRWLPVYDPARGDAIAEVPLSSREDVREAVESAQLAFPSWAATPVVERARVMFRFRDLLEANRQELARSVTTENGKNLTEAYAEVGRGIEVVEFACGAPTLMQGDVLANIAHGIDGEMIRYPLGVVAGITPFNFPAMIPLWMIPLALVTGNTMVLKPSERTPLTTRLIADLAFSAGLPDRVLQVVNGDAEAVDALLTDPDVRAVSFVGSQPVAEHVYRTAAANGKRVQALGGAKNFQIVMPDANLPKSAQAIVSSAFGSAGERCLAASVVLAVDGIGDALVDELVRAADNLKIGDGREGNDLGPVIRREHRDRVVGYIQRGIAEHAQIRRDGTQDQVASPGFFLGPTIFDHVEPGMAIGQEEIFGPVLSVMRVESLVEAVAVANRSRFGNSASIYTQNGAAVRYFRESIQAGMLGVNIGVAAPMAFFPFSGWKNSFYGDLHATGRDAVEFYTDKKVITTRWF